MVKVAITGNIGSGKSTIANLFGKLFNVPIFFSDLCARQCENIPEVKQKFKEILGDDIYVDDVVDRNKLREIVFLDKVKLQAITKVISPELNKMFELFMEKNSDSPYVIFESAIIFETGNTSNFDYIITVSANIDIRIKRVMERDGSTREEVINKINNQYSDSYKIENSTFVIYNNGINISDSAEYLSERINFIHKLILEKTNGQTNH